jgi:hypothetical protein
MALLAIESATTAIGHFRRAAKLDPEGYYGRLAAKHLSQRSVWGGAGIKGSRCLSEARRSSDAHWLKTGCTELARGLRQQVFQTYEFPL